MIPSPSYFLFVTSLGDLRASIHFGKQLENKAKPLRSRPCFATWPFFVLNIPRLYPELGREGAPGRYFCRIPIPLFV